MNPISEALNKTIEPYSVFSLLRISYILGRFIKGQCYTMNRPNFYLPFVKPASISEETLQLFLKALTVTKHDSLFR